MSQPKPENEAVAELCPACGLCCNGVLFSDVELRAGDEPGRLTELNLFKRGRKTAFPQPCPCFDGKLCRIYPDRPVRCRTFECKALKRVLEGSFATSDALRIIGEARRLAEGVREHLRQLGNLDEQLSLSRRYARVMAEPMDLADHDDAELRAALMLKVDQLMKMLHKHFLG